MKTHFIKSNCIINWGVLFLIFSIFPTLVKSQQGYNISGEITCLRNGVSIAFANIALLDTAHTYIFGGAASDEKGVFNMNNVVPGTYHILISALGYEKVLKKVELANNNLVLGSIEMPETHLELKDVEIVADRIKARQTAGNTTFFISPKMRESSNTGTDILRLLPGVAVDLQQNVSLEGSRNIIILVDGKERDRSYLSQLAASVIDKVEIISSPPARYDASITGVINVLLKKERSSGLEGRFYVEIPTSASEVFLTPSYSLNYGIGKFNLFTSYNGDLRRFNITDSSQRKINNHAPFSEIKSIQSLRQDTWSHRFHFGFDWYINELNQLNFYGFRNPFSQELDGTIKAEATGAESIYWQADKNDQDINQSWFNSLWYKHLFDKTSGHELTLESSWYVLNAENSTTFTDVSDGFQFENNMQPRNHSIHTRLDYVLPVGGFIKLYTGFQMRLRSFHDSNAKSFHHQENTYSGYGTLSYRRQKLETSIGLRTENIKQETGNGNKTTGWFLLPDVLIRYGPDVSQSLVLIYRRSLSYPGFYQLNPSPSMEDILTITTGNPLLRPEIHNRVHLEYSRRLKNHYLAARLFGDHISNSIGKWMSVNEDGCFEVQTSNMGEIYTAGIQFSGALGFGKAGMNPYIKAFDAWSLPHQFVGEHQVESRHQLVVESGLSAYFTFGKGFTASTTFQFTTPMNEFQGSSFSGALYFLSFEKSFSKGLKAGIVSGMPMAKNFTYKGYKVDTTDFSYYSKADLNLSTVPLWIKISYQFSSGRNRQKIERSKSAPVHETRKGF